MEGVKGIFALQAEQEERLGEAGAQLNSEAGSSYSEDQVDEGGQGQQARTQSPPATKQLSRGGPGRTECRKDVPVDDSAKSGRAASESGRPWHNRHGSGRPWPHQRKQQERKEADKTVKKLWESMLTHSSHGTGEPAERDESESVHCQRRSSNRVAKPLSSFDGRGRARTRSPPYGSAPGELVSRRRFSPESAKK